MRAAVLRNMNDEALEILDVETAAVEAGQVRVAIRATGVCHSDLSVMNGTIPQGAPCVLGHEGAGEIVELGAGVTNLALGDRVIVVWVPVCGECQYCLRGKPNLCMAGLMQYGKPRFLLDGNPISGMAGAGTFAEELVLPQQAVVKVPDDTPFEIASLIGCGVMTGVGAAINTAQLRPGSNAVVIGLGGVGISTIQGAKVAGAAEIVGVDLSEERRQQALRFGATHVCGPDELQALTAQVTTAPGSPMPMGFDYAFECIGRPETIRQAYDLVARGGTAVIVGVGRMTEQVTFNAFELFYAEKTIKGTIYGSADVRVDFHRILRLWKAGRLDLEGMITNRIKIDEINSAFTDMKAGKGIRTVVEF